MITCYDDIVGLDIEQGAQLALCELPRLAKPQAAAARPSQDEALARRRTHFAGQLTGNVERPIIPSGLAPYLHLPAPEPRTLTRARMAAAIAQLVAGSGQVTRDDLVASGFTPAEIADLFTEARRISGVEKMVA